ncbi:50S ribosomal protein L29 [Acidianus sulfidivorans JP7]|uniref:Large ribosomal subunit protein uL29 n=1 Tax=Acidianus sulfidivorans JP7 TaxID=619593 RepID=A0A2U9IMR3_9CREN|nr:50S ribosomal protein L29 [Acidianus sulfidivorans]AWR97290.1 50S ribosomal protein L29 [Acidianus sulfidivorans JP7]
MPLKAKDLRNMDLKELNAKLAELSEELLKRKAESRMGTIKNTSSIRNIKKDIARVLTVINEKKKSTSKQTIKTDQSNKK